MTLEQDEESTSEEINPAGLSPRALKAAK